MDSREGNLAGNRVRSRSKLPNSCHVDARTCEITGEQQTGRPGPDHDHLGAESVS
ncbi:hypothetical protein [Nonomuraea phyllanthi]|uniref:hypothetical protein n=1 Tax=Nonomuraea phyllanthi TaxID=2219224 RepID=UPI001293A529|nr:hypothetical protein [Nonomuraea phyllanthi]